jgi:hypothetical protein
MTRVPSANKSRILRGRKWGYHFGSFNNLQYVLSRLKAGPKDSDIPPVKHADYYSSATASLNERTDVHSGGLVA